MIMNIQTLLNINFYNGWCSNENEKTLLSVTVSTFTKIIILIAACLPLASIPGRVFAKTRPGIEATPPLRVDDSLELTDY